jgi:hypothetical protein
MCYLSFSAWLVSLNLLSSRLIHIDTNDGVSLFFMVNYHAYGPHFLHLSIHPSIYPCTFHILAMVKVEKTATSLINVPQVAPNVQAPLILSLDKTQISPEDTEPQPRCSGLCQDGVQTNQVQSLVLRAP